MWGPELDLGTGEKCAGNDICKNSHLGKLLCLQMEQSHLDCDCSVETIAMFTVSQFGFFFNLFSETGSHSVVQAGRELTM